MEGSTVAADNILPLISFKLGNEEYAVDIIKVHEINRIPEIATVPNSEDYIEGVVNLRGKIIPVVNLRKKFGMPEWDTDDRSRIIIMDLQGIMMGILVDSVAEVLRIPPDIMEPAPEIASSISKKFIKGIAQLDERLAILIDIDRLMEES
ncbi:MAG TPA: chemotaxis protein CheW [Nitrospirae bacterium]|nr:chemotaxis protein CheW [bacterium BMS3Abin06]HDH12964.1 chemotaxis protein CheW [Nitrospirota bacterium]HDZ00452.1 chemotaxis protein CheW [Nitrospirota bacterium]